MIADSGSGPSEQTSLRSKTPIAVWIATVGGVGYAPVAPGTFGSAVGLVLWWLLPHATIVHASAIILLFVLGCWTGSVAERHFGRTDPGQVVIDEVVGMLITMLLNPVGWKSGIAGFLLFRVIDVIKPFPSNRLERLHGGVGVMADDAMAAVYANAVLRLLILASGIW